MSGPHSAGKRGSGRRTHAAAPETAAANRGTSAELPEAADLPDLNIDRLKFRQLALILALEESQNLHRAAERIGLSQPAATKLLREIETALRVSLFDRQPRGMVPTIYGSAVAHHAAHVLNDVRKMQRELTDLRQGLSGTVHLGAVMAAVPNLIVEAFAIIERLHPRISLTLMTGSSDLMAAALHDHRINLMIGRRSGSTDSQTFDFETLIEEDLSIVVGLNHPLLRRTILSLAELSTERWIMQSVGSPLRRLLEASFERLALPFPPHPVETVSMLGTVTLLQRTELIGCLPTSVARFFTGLGTIAELPVELPVRLTPFSLVTLKGQALTPAVEYLMATLRKVARGIA